MAGKEACQGGGFCGPQSGCDPWQGTLLPFASLPSHETSVMTKKYTHLSGARQAGFGVPAS